MKTLTENLIKTIMESDEEITAEQRDGVLTVLRIGKQPEDMCGEREAAKILGISGMTLNWWRRGKRKKADPFPFTVYPTPAGTYRYDRFEVQRYVQEQTLPSKSKI